MHRRGICTGKGFHKKLQVPYCHLDWLYLDKSPFLLYPQITTPTISPAAAEPQMAPPQTWCPSSGVPSALRDLLHLVGKGCSHPWPGTIGAHQDHLSGLPRGQQPAPAPPPPPGLPYQRCAEESGGPLFQKLSFPGKRKLKSRGQMASKEDLENDGEFVREKEGLSSKADYLATSPDEQFILMLIQHQFISCLIEHIHHTVFWGFKILRLNNTLKTESSTPLTL